MLNDQNRRESNPALWDQPMSTTSAQSAVEWVLIVSSLATALLAALCAAIAASFYPTATTLCLATIALMLRALIYETTVMLVTTILKNGCLNGLAANLLFRMRIAFVYWRLSVMRWARSTSLMRFYLNLRYGD